jgi:hypothetical protein
MSKLVKIFMFAGISAIIINMSHNLYERNQFEKKYFEKQKTLYNKITENNSSSKVEYTAYNRNTVFPAQCGSYLLWSIHRDKKK